APARPRSGRGGGPQDPARRRGGGGVDGERRAARDRAGARHPRPTGAPARPGRRPLPPQVSARERLRVQVVIDTLTWGGAEMLLADLAAGAEEAGLDLSIAYLKDLDGSPAAVRLRQRGIEPRLVPMTLLHNPAGFARIRRHL